MNDRPDLYVVLGVSPDASPGELRDSYRTRVRLLHPDRFDRATNPLEWAAANGMLRKLNAASDVLSKPESRARYDEAHRASFTNYRPETAQPSYEEEFDPPPSSPPRTHVKPRPKIWPYVYAVLLFLVVWSTAEFDKNKRRSEARQDPAPSALVSVTESLPAPPDQAVADDEPTPAQIATPPVSPPRVEPAPVGCELGIEPSPLPSNGTLWTYHDTKPLAPLEVRTSDGGQFLVKLDQAGESVASIFVTASSSAEMLVPLGRYTLKYATGDGRYWCGEAVKKPFGTATSFFKAEHTFNFRDAGDHYAGYVVELVQQEDGNLSTEPIPSEEW